MKTVTITVSIEQDKLKALQFYANKRKANLQSELDEFLLKLYEKYVPVQTREYIESQVEPSREQPKRPSRPAHAIASTTAHIPTDPIRRQS